MKRGIIGSGLLVSTLIGSTGVWASGILVNPSFEANTGGNNASDNVTVRGWQNLQWSGTSSGARTGKDGNNYYFQWQNATLRTSPGLRPNALPGQQFNLSFLFGIESGTTLWEDSYVYIDFFDTGGALLSSHQHVLPRTPADSVLSTRNANATAPANTAFVGVRLHSRSLSGNAVNMDRVVLNRVTPTGIVSYNFGAVGSHSWNPVVTGTNLSALAITKGAGLDGNSPGGNLLVNTSEFVGTMTSAGVDRPGMFVRTIGTAATVDDAVAGNDYIEFSVNPDVNYALNLTGVSFDSLLQFNQNGTMTSTIQLRSSVDGFASSLGQVTRSLTSAYGAGADAVTAWNYDMLTLGSGFESLTGPVQFRLYFADNIDLESGVVRMDNIQIHGSTALIPEPASLALLAMGSLLTMSRRRAG